MANKVSGWKEKILTPAGKEILIKSVAQAVPSYTMSCFLLPKNLCEELTNVIRQFWWGQTGSKKKIAWLNWDTMCLPKNRGGLGFRDLRSFDLALLAKQGWWLLTNSNSLFSRVYKAKYFPHCSFTKATLGRSPSYAWRSLMAVQNIDRRGMRWQVGNGNKIRIWHNQWIPRPCMYRVITKERPNSTNTLVCELINRATGEWNIDKLNSWFIPEDRDAILGIPLSSSNTQDRMIWAENSSGKFTVKSAHTLALEEKSHATRADCSDESARRKIWKSIWRLKIPPKIKHFAWRVAQGILATKSNLAKRKITSDGICELCGVNEETVCHLLWTCDHAKEVWSNSKFALPFKILPQWNFLDILEKLQGCDHSRPGQMEQFITVCWGIWKNRNDLRMGGKGKAGRTVLRNALHLMEEFRSATEAKTEHLAKPMSVVSWQPPCQGYYKVNIDGAVFSDRKQAGAGVLIRDSTGEVVAALSKKWKWSLGAIEVEAKALEVGVIFAKDVGIRDAEFESDSLLVCNALQGLGLPPALVVTVLVGIMDQVSHFRQWKFTHTKRQGMSLPIYSLNTLNMLRIISHG